jgi:transcriptional regulator with XRE-family HTH domain
MVRPPAPKRTSEREALGNALKRLRRRAELTQEEAAGRAGVVVQSWRRYEWGQRDLSLAKAARLAEALGFTEADLLRERDFNMGRADRPAPRLGMQLPHGGTSTVLIIRDRVQAGAWLMAEDLDQGEPRTYPAVSDPRYPLASQWLSEVVGDSVNELRIFSGDLVHCVSVADIGYAPKSGDVVEVERLRFGGAERELTLKQVEVTPDGVLLWPRSTNPRWREPLSLTEGVGEGEEIEVLIRGVVLAAIRRF